MKKYLFIVLLVGVCFGQTIADLNAEQKLQYNRNKLSIDVVQKTIGGVAGNAVHSESWNQWTAYQGLRNKITEYEFFTITGYENEANTIRENYIKSKSKLVNSKIMFGASLSLFAIGWSMINNNNINEIKKELDQVRKEQKNIDLQIRLKEAELAFIVNPKNLKSLNASYLNLISRPISNVENLISNLNSTIKLTNAKVFLNEEIN